ncbi:MAG: hypothetical protein IJ428_02865 [Clostridia bacterium]|nr:hypothetical protein [Clostridia bacterium]
MSLSNGNGMGPADIAAVVNGGYGGGWGNGGFGGNGVWDILVLFLLFGLLGNGGFGRGFGGGGCGANTTCATPADVHSAVDQQTLISKLDQQTYGLADATYALNNSITSGFAQAELSRCNMQAAFMAQLNAMAMADQKCCCETQRLIERGFCDTNYNLATQSTAIQSAICGSTRDIIDNANCNTRAILDFLVKDKIDTLQAENQNLRLKASQADQNAVLRAAIDASTAEIIRRTGNECPVPAYVVPNPNCCYGNPLGVGYNNYGGYGNGCGCGAA